MSSITLAWDANPEPDLDHYILHYGQTLTPSTHVNVGKVTSFKVDNLSPGTYYFTLTAVNTNGSESQPSDQVSYTISTPPKLIKAVSRKTHGNKGDFDIPISIDATSLPPIECRGDTNLTIVAFFDVPITTGNVSVATRSGKKAELDGSPTFSGQTIIIKLKSVSDGQLLRLTITNVTSKAGGILPSCVIRMRVLIGDVDGNNIVDINDLNIPINQDNFKWDINCTGNINNVDYQAISNRLGNKAPSS